MAADPTIIELLERAAVASDRKSSKPAIEEMKQSIDAAIVSVESMLATGPDGKFVTVDDVNEMNRAVTALRGVLGRVETRLAAFNAKDRKHAKSSNHLTSNLDGQTVELPERHGLLE